MIENMTRRRRQVIVGIAWGKSNKEIANALFLARSTVEKHRFALREQYQLNNTADITRFAFKHGLIKLEEL